MFNENCIFPFVSESFQLQMHIWIEKCSSGRVQGRGNFLKTTFWNIWGQRYTTILCKYNRIYVIYITSLRLYVIHTSSPYHICCVSFKENVLMPQQQQQPQQLAATVTVVAESAAVTAAAAGRRWCGGRVESMVLDNTRNCFLPTLTTRPLPGCAVSNVSEGTQILVLIVRLSIA